MSKKANIFGKKVPVFVIALIAVMGLAAAALVPYLSGLITGAVTVNSPLQLIYTATSSACTTGNPFTCTVYGGEVVGTSGTLTNNGPAGTPGVIVLVFTPPTGHVFSGDNDGITITANGITLSSATSTTAVSSGGAYVALAGGHFDGGVVAADNIMGLGEVDGPSPGQVTFAPNIYPGVYSVKVFAVEPGQTVDQIAATTP